jgi:hypothetical protein
VLPPLEELPLNKLVVSASRKSSSVFGADRGCVRSRMSLSGGDDLLDAKRPCLYLWNEMSATMPKPSAARDNSVRASVNLETISNRSRAVARDRELAKDICEAVALSKNVERSEEPELDNADAALETPKTIAIQAVVIRENNVTILSITLFVDSVDSVNFDSKILWLSWVSHVFSSLYNTTRQGQQFIRASGAQPQHVTAASPVFYEK